MMEQRKGREGVDIEGVDIEGRKEYSLICTHVRSCYGVILTIIYENIR